MYALRDSHVTGLSSYAKFRMEESSLDECPLCMNSRIARTPRRKGGPVMFHCRKCSYMANVTDLWHARWQLGHQAA